MAAVGAEVNRNIRLPAAVRTHGIFCFGPEYEAASAEPRPENVHQPGHDQLMDEIGHFLLLDATIDQLARLVLGHGGPFLERHETTELGPRWVLRRERHDALDVSTLHQARRPGGEELEVDLVTCGALASSPADAGG